MLDMHDKRHAEAIIPGVRRLTYAMQNRKTSESFQLRCTLGTWHPGPHSCSEISPPSFQEGIRWLQGWCRTSWAPLSSHPQWRATHVPLRPRDCVRVDRAVLGVVHEAPWGDKQDAQGVGERVVPCDLVSARLAREEVFLDSAEHGSDKRPSA